MNLRDMNINPQVYDKWGNVVCRGNKADIKEGHKSFPSGHASCEYFSPIFKPKSRKSRKQ